jgi:hypothetical protein
VLFSKNFNGYARQDCNTDSKWVRCVLKKKWLHWFNTNEAILL